MTAIELLLAKLKQEIFQKKRRIKDFKIEKAGYFDWNKVINGEKSDLNKGLGGIDSHYQIVFPYPDSVTDDMNEGLKPCVWVKTTDTDIWNTNNPQFIVSHNQKIIRSLDMNHSYFLLPPKNSEEITLNVYTNTEKPDIFIEVWFGYQNTCVFQLFYRLKAIYESYQLCQKESPTRVIYQGFFERILSIVEGDYDSPKKYQECLEKIDKWLLYQDEVADSPIVEHVIGHTHIDLSWLWTIEQTKEKVVRSFSNALYLLNIYPEMTFMSSTPLLYEFLHEQDQNSYEQIKGLIEQERWFIEGGMYVESDINLPSGESLIRQIYYGKKFFSENFNKETRILWLPDCFGFSASLPQIIKKAELDYFFTSKMDWNETNKMPNDIFFWEGIDGSKVLSYFLTTSDYSEDQSVGTTYNGRLNASQVKGTWTRFKNKELSKEVLQIYGFGDGGGGPTEEMLEYSKVFQHQLPNMPRIEHSSPQLFFNHLEKNIQGKKVPKWRGELYLETHRGTYTTDGLLKRMNRETENLLLITEWINVIAHFYQEEEAADYPMILEKAWKKVLINHFHDILPGTSIQQVHDEAIERYQSAIIMCQELISDKLADLGLKDISSFSQVSEEDIWVGNPTSYLRNEVVSDEENDYLIENIPAFGFKKIKLSSSKEKKKNIKGLNIADSNVVEKITECSYKIETKHYRFILHDSGEIREFYDKALQRNLTEGQGAFNQFQLFNDMPKEYDAWNLDQESLSQQINIGNKGQIEDIVESKHKLEISYSRTLRNSTVFQTITLYEHTKRIDFKTIVDWQERQKCLKINFATNLIMPKATYDIQFGNVERPSYVNTSWDDARFEVCAHKWADLSEKTCGIALLNNCKYGYSARENQLSLTLLRSPQNPAKDIDKRIQEFTYSLYPHEGTVEQSRVYKEAYALNVPLIFGQRTEESPRVVEDLLLIDLSEKNVICESIKMAYEDDAYIIRCYESFGKTTSCNIRVNQQVSSVETVSLLENITDEKFSYLSSEGIITAEFKPFEIRTFKLYLSDRSTYG